MEKKLIERSLLICLVIAILYLGFTKELKLLINPEYYILIILSVVFLTALIFATKYTSSKTGSFKIFQSSYILFTVMICLMFSTSYSEYQKQLSDTRGINIGEEVVYGGGSGNSTDKYAFDIPPEIPVYDEENITITESNFFEAIDSLYIHTDSYLDKTVKINGFAYYIDGVDSKNFVIARLTMICCAADSSIYGLLCDNSKIEHKFEKDKWYSIEGTIKKELIKLNTEYTYHPVIEISKFQQIETPDDPYVYPTFN